MGKVKVDSLYLSNIANSIRTKLGSQTKFKPSEMASAIDSIPTGGGGNFNPLLASYPYNTIMTGTVYHAKSNSSYVTYSMICNNDGNIRHYLSFRGTQGTGSNLNSYYGYRYVNLDTSKYYKITCTIRAVNTPTLNDSSQTYHANLQSSATNVAFVKPTSETGTKLPTDVNTPTVLTEYMYGKNSVWIGFMFDKLYSSGTPAIWYDYTMDVNLEEITEEQYNNHS